MSLINEALRKARKEAAERDADERGVTYRPPRAHLPTERSWLPALAGVALGAVLAAAAFWLLMPRGSTDEASTPTPAETVAEAAVSSPVSSPVPPPAEPATTPDPAAVPASSEPRASQPPPPEPPAAANDTEKETPEVPPAEAVEPAEDATPEQPTEEPNPAPASGNHEVQRVQAPEQVGQVDEATFVLEATVDGVALRLDFIVWGASPFAQINGHQVSVGQSVEGFLVRDITREEVTLEGAGGPFTLRIR